MVAEDGKDAELIAAYLERWERSAPEERGRLAWVLLGNAVVNLALYSALAGDVAFSAARVWRRRDRGWRAALATGPCWRSLAALTTVTASYRLVSRGLFRRGVAAREGGPQTR